MRGTAIHGNTPFDVPFISQIEGNLWQGGCTNGLILPPFIEHIVSLYPWENYTVNHEIKSSLAVIMYDDLSGPTEQVVRSVAQWVNACRAQGPTLVHCFPAGTLVDAPVPVPIERAEEVIGHDGRLHKVTAHMTRDYAGALTVIGSTGTLPLRCTPEHPVLVVRPYRFPGGFVAKPGMRSLERVSTAVRHYEAQPTWLPAREVALGDMLVAPRPSFDSDPLPVDWGVFAPNARRLQPLVAGAEAAWMVGQYVADGGTQGHSSIGFCTSRVADAERLAVAWDAMGAVPRVRDYGAYQRVTVSSRAARERLAEWCGRSDTKRLPAFVFDGWPLSAILAGVVAGDGYVDSRGRIEVMTISPVLARQLHMLLRSLGESPTMKATRRHSGYPNAKPGVTVRWAPMATQRQTAWWRGLYLMPVTSVTVEPYEGTVHNLAVADAETYTVAGVTVHNCQAGLNRSSLVAAYALMLAGATAADAIELLRQERSPAALCNPAFADWLRALPQPLENF